MPQPTEQDLHVDQVRTELSIAYMNVREFLAGDAIAPLLKMPKQSDRYAKWSRADFMRIQMEIIADDVPAPIMSMGVSTEPFFCDVFAGKKFVTARQRSQAANEFELDEATVAFVTHQALLRREKLIADELFVTGKWASDVTPSTKWSAGSADPLGDLELGMTTVQTQIGRNPTDLILGEDVWKTLKHHSDITGRITGGATAENPARVMPEHLAALIGVKRVTVAASTYNSASADASVSMSQMYATNDCLLVYRPDSASKFDPSGAYTFSWDEFDEMTEDGAAITTWLEDDPKGEYFRGQMAVDPKVTATEAGYFFSAATS